MVKAFIQSLKNKSVWPVFLTAMALLLLLGAGYLLNKEGKIVFAKRTQLASLRQDLDLLDKILAEKKANDEKIKTVIGSLPKTHEEIAAAVYQLEATARKNGQTWENAIEPTAQKEPNQISSLKMIFKTAGSYRNFSQMMAEIANLTYHTRLDSLQIEKAEGGILGTVNLRLYINQ